MSKEELHNDVFNPAESDLEYFQRRQRELAPARGSALPWTCPQHPNAQIRHTWDETRCVLNGIAAGEGIKSKHRYECAECGQELAAQNLRKTETART